jgi:outer membrane protein OmpA-like peptidoglycan-associated protein
MKTILRLPALAITFSFFGCASAPPPQALFDARASYERARTGPAATLDPADLHTAKESLDAAESFYNKDGDTQETRDMAYAASRRAAIAEAIAGARAADQQRAQTIAQMQALQAQALSVTSAELGQAKGQLATQGQQLQDEQRRRQDAERRATQAAADLAAFASVKQETRGMVITLNGSVLFASGKTDLLDAARTRLNDVATALKKEDPDAKIVVEGHTDSQGPASFNQDLSQRRAEAVRGYLVSHGLSSDRITSQGFGPTRPIADNASPEGRANNRRVEIVVQPTSGGSDKSDRSDKSAPSSTKP